MAGTSPAMTKINAVIPGRATREPESQICLTETNVEIPGLALRAIPE